MTPHYGLPSSKLCANDPICSPPHIAADGFEDRNHRHAQEPAALNSLHGVTDLTAAHRTTGALPQWQNPSSQAIAGAGASQHVGATGLPGEHSLWGGDQLWQSPVAPLQRHGGDGSQTNEASSASTEAAAAALPARRTRGPPPGFAQHLHAATLQQQLGSRALGSGRQPPPGFGGPQGSRQELPAHQSQPAQGIAATNGVQGHDRNFCWQQQAPALQHLQGAGHPSDLSRDLQRLSFGRADVRDQQQQQQPHQHIEHHLHAQPQFQQHDNLPHSCQPRQAQSLLPGASHPGHVTPVVPSDLQRLGLGHIALQQYQQHSKPHSISQQHCQQPSLPHSQPQHQVEHQYQVQQGLQPQYAQPWQHQGGFAPGLDMQPGQPQHQQGQPQASVGHQQIPSGTFVPAPGPAVGPPEQQSQQILVATQLQQQQLAQHQQDLQLQAEQREAEQRQALLHALQQPDQQAALVQVLQQYPDLQQQLLRMAANPQGQPQLPPQPQQQLQQQQLPQQQQQQQQAQPALQQRHSLPAPLQQDRQPSPQQRSHKARRLQGDMAQLNEELLQLVQRLQPSPEERSQQAAAFDSVRQLLQARWPGSQVHLFGSTATRLNLRSSNDLDISLDLPSANTDKAAVVAEVAQLMEAAGMHELLCLTKARIPVVKFEYRRTSGAIKVDITVNNHLAVTNTRLLADYAAIDGRLAQLVFVIKAWAKARNTNDAYRGTLSSYCYVLMCISLLQQRSPPVLPVLQAMQPTFRRTIDKWCCDYNDDVRSLLSFGAANTETLAELAASFFSFWAWDFNYGRDVVSIRTGRLLTKHEKGWTRRVGSERHLVGVEDPFDTSHDLGRTVDRQTCTFLRGEFERAARLLYEHAHPFEQLFQPSPTHNSK